eukprot:11477214-Alexandrium_andersonii.AAC.1
MPHTRLVESSDAGQVGADTAPGDRRHGGPWAYPDRPAAAKPPDAADGAGDVPDGMFGPSTDGPEDVADAGPASSRA